MAAGGFYFHCEYWCANFLRVPYIKIEFNDSYAFHMHDDDFHMKFSGLRELEIL